MAHGEAREGKWRGNWRMECVASTLHTTSEHGVSSITTADAHTTAAKLTLPGRFKWTRPFRRKTKSGFCACVITFQTRFTVGMGWGGVRVGWYKLPGPWLRRIFNIIGFWRSCITHWHTLIFFWFCPPSKFFRETSCFFFKFQTMYKAPSPKRGPYYCICWKCFCLSWSYYLSISHINSFQTKPKLLHDWQWHFLIWCKDL